MGRFTAVLCVLLFSAAHATRTSADHTATADDAMKLLCVAIVITTLSLSRVGSLLSWVVVGPSTIGVILGSIVEAVAMLVM